MRSNLVIAVLTAVLAIGAGVAIAGLPRATPGADLRVREMPTISSNPNITLPSATVQPLITGPPVSTGSATTTTVAPTTVPKATMTTTTTPGGEVSVVTPRPTPTTTGPPDPGDDLRERASLDVSVANGGAVNGIASATASALDTEGYSAVQPVDAENPTATTTVYYELGLELEAARLASDLGWDPVAIAPISEMPPLATDATFELVAMVGLDNAPPP